MGSKNSYGQDSTQLHPEDQLPQDSIKTDVKPEKQMPFRKGRVLLGATIFISSDAIRIDTIPQSSTRISNDYNFEVIAGYFVIDKFLVGVVFRTKRFNSTEFVYRESEYLQVGPYLRYYISPNSKGGVFIPAEITFTMIRDEVRLNIGNTSLERMSKGKGLGVLLGVGYSFSPFDRMSIDMSVRYNFVFGRAEIHDLTNNELSHEDFIYNQVLFGLGINLFLL